MGLLSSLFSKKNPSHQENWATYLSTINNDKVGAIMVDLGLKMIAPVTGKLNCLDFELQMNEPREDGLSSAEENGVLIQIEEELILALGKSCIYAGHLKADGKLNVFVYLGGEKPDNVIAKTMSKFPTYGFKYKVAEEKDWKTYSDLLYPLPVQMRSIENFKVVRVLMQHGDDLNQARPVDHYIYFKTERDQADFLLEIEGEDFRFETETVKSYGEYIYQLHLSREDRVDAQSVDNYVLPLWEMAQKCNGIYDGWGAISVKKDVSDSIH